MIGVLLALLLVVGARWLYLEHRRRHMRQVLQLAAHNIGSGPNQTPAEVSAMLERASTLY